MYPIVRRNESIFDNFYGKNVTDPYRWLEDPYSDETKQFIATENEISQSFIGRNTEWKKINERLTTMWNYTKFTVPYRSGNYYFSYLNSGLQNQLYVHLF